MAFLGHTGLPVSPLERANELCRRRSRHAVGRRTRASIANANMNAGGSESADSAPPRRRKEISVSFGLRFLVGALVKVAFVLWPLLDQLPFTVILAGFCVVGQNDYYRICESQGHLPARRTGVITTTLMMFALLFSARYAEAVIPIGSTLICCYLLFRQKPRIATIADLSTTLAGLFYGGLLPSYFVRLHALNTMAESPLRSWIAAGPLMPVLGSVPTSGALMLFVTNVAGAASDQVQFLVTALLPAVPAREKVAALLGFGANVSVIVVGAHLLGWPRWRALGLIYGMIFGVCELIGRVTTPLFQRANDETDEIVSYRQMFRRTDRYVFLAPLAYCFAALLL